MPASVPEVLAAWMQPFAVYFTTAVWRHVLVLVAGALLAPGRRTVTATLLDNDKHAIAGQKVVWYVNGKKVATLTTDSTISRA